MALSVYTELMAVSFCWLANTGMSMCRCLLENVAYKFVLTFPAVPHMSCSSYLDGLCDGKQVAIQLPFCEVLTLTQPANSIFHADKHYASYTTIIVLDNKK